ncbi:BglG family transcription antiterminator [Ligilactobacillus saerimneri]|uniref:BglG family transcription antiterminator n=1 Tax=Ligilactobacillus saerimneri TaxID=228229 RepID=UPI001C126CAD|nr:PRD domain-containing protein [Ligilactobacillus saerimneri]MBU5309737.1 PRD domain-containing protein [Ligilactobacillus saerimneri]
MAQQKEEQLLAYLRENPGWHKTNELALHLNVSVRTIRNYYKRLASHAYIVSSREGYKYQGPTGHPSLVASTDVSRERVYLFLNKLLHDTKPQNIYDLAATMFLSETIIKKIAAQAKEYAVRFNVHINLQGDFYHITGAEEDKRHMLSDMLYTESENRFVSQSVIKENFPSIDTDRIFAIVEQCADDNDVYLNTFDLSNIVLHIIIALERIKAGQDIHDNHNAYQSSLFARELLTQIERYSTITLPREDKVFLSLIIDGSVSRWEPTLVENTPKEFLTLIEVIVTYIKDTYKIDLAQNNFSNQFTIHIIRLVQRLQEGTVIHNPMVTSLKTSSPTIYECAVLIAHQISAFAGQSVPDAEIAYIAMHVGNAIAEQIADEKKLKVAILAPEYQDSLIPVANRITKTFPELVIQANVTDEEQIPTNVDMVIALNQKVTKVTIPHVTISLFFTNQDIKRIRRKMAEVVEIKGQHSFEKHIAHFFDSRLFYMTSTRQTREEIVTLAAKKLADNGVVGTDYREKLMQREQMSSTAFGKFAIPHSIRMEAQQTKAFVYINPTGVQWDKNNKVYLVVALAFRPDDSKAFRAFFDKFSEIMVEEQNIATLITSRSYNDFLNNIASMM